jgi:hypothetical protein
VENIVIDFRTFADDGAFDATNVSDATITVKASLSGFTDTATITGAGDNGITVGAGIENLIIEGYDEGIITAGAESDVSIDVEGEGDTLILNAEGDVTIDAESEGDYTNVTITGATGATVTWAYEGAAEGIEELELVGDFTLVLDGEAAAILDAEVAVNGASTVLEFAAESGAVDLTDVVVASISISAEGEAVEFTTAENQTFTIDAAEADVTIDTGEDGGSYSVAINADDATLDLNAAEGESATVTINADVENITALTFGATLNLVTEAGGDVTIETLTEAETDDEVVVTGAGAITVDALAATTFDASEATGAMDLTVAVTDATINTGSAADTITMGAEAEGDVTVATNGGNDEFNLSEFAGESYYIDGGAGNDTFNLADGENNGTGGEDYVIVGGAGTDSIMIDLVDGEEFDVSGLNLTLSGIESIKIEGDAVAGEGAVGEGDVVFAASALDGLTLSIAGNSTGDQHIEFQMAEGTDLDLSGITIGSSIETITVDFVTNADAEDAITATLTSRGEVVTGPADVVGFDINLAGGADEFTIGAVGGDLTLGSGDDTVIFNAEGEAGGAEDTDGVVIISDFTIEEDLIVTAEGTIGEDILSAEAVDLAGVDAEAEAEDAVAIVTDGVVTISGADADLFDTFQEWVDVILEIAGEGAYAFELDGSTYVISDDGLDAVELVGVTGATLSDGAGDNIIVIGAA